MKFKIIISIGTKHYMHSCSFSCSPNSMFAIFWYFFAKLWHQNKGLLCNLHFHSHTTSKLQIKCTCRYIIGLGSKRNLALNFYKMRLKIATRSIRGWAEMIQLANSCTNVHLIRYAIISYGISNCSVFHKFIIQTPDFSIPKLYNEFDPKKYY